VGRYGQSPHRQKSLGRPEGGVGEEGRREGRGERGEVSRPTTVFESCPKINDVAYVIFRYWNSM